MRACPGSSPRSRARGGHLRAGLAEDPKARRSLISTKDERRREPDRAIPGSKDEQAATKASHLDRVGSFGALELDPDHEPPPADLTDEGLARLERRQAGKERRAGSGRVIDEPS